MSEGPPGRARRMTATTWAILTAVIALAGSAIGLLFQLVPALKPDPLDRIGAAVSVFAVEPDVTIGAWTRRAYPDDPGAELRRLFGTEHPVGDRLRTRGTVLYVRVKVDGYKHRSVALSWRVYTPDGRAVPHYEQIAAAPEIPPVELDSPDRESVQVLFVPGLRELQDIPKTFVRVELSDGEGILAATDSQLLRHGAPPERTR